MALISCPECKKEVSEFAPLCPSCGIQVKKRLLQLKEEEEKRLAEAAAQAEEEKATMIKTIGIAILIFVILAILHNAGVK